MSEAAIGDEPASTKCRRHALKAPLVAAIVWLALAFVALSVGAVPYDVGESICGVWGCFPPLPALAAMHLLWCVVLGACVHAAHRWRPRILFPLGILLASAGGITAAVLLGTDLHRWLNQVHESNHSDWLRRVGYTLATATDVPIVQSLLASLACLVISKRAHRR